MIRITNVSKTYGADPVLRDVTITLSPGERAGLVGPNGCGKSTLLRIMTGEVAPDSGNVWVDPGTNVAYLPQYPADDLHLSIRDSLLRGMGRVGDLKTRIDTLENAITSASGNRLDSLLLKYSAVREEFERLDGYAVEARIQEVISGLRIGQIDPTAPVQTLSGGNKTKLSLARLLLSDADILLLDEPTNYLDLPALLWLEHFVTSGRQTYLIVSHDRRFLDCTVSSILELDPSTHTIRTWTGSFSDYAEGSLREEQKRLEAYRDRQAEVRRIQEDIRRTREQARTIDRRNQSDYRGTSRSQLGVDRGRAGKVARKAKVRERKLESMVAGPDEIEKPVQGWGLHLVDLGGSPIEDDRIVLDAQDLYAGYEDREVVRGVSLLLRGRDRVALLGENGSGKTTLLRCLSGEMEYTGHVRIGPSIRMGILSQEGRELSPDRTVLDTVRDRTPMREDEARTYLHRFLFKGDEVFKPVGTLSYGQRAKLALATLILSGANFLLLDEPTSHLDMPALEAIEHALAGFRGPLLVVSHDRYFLERLNINRVEVMDNGALRTMESVAEYANGLTVSA